MFTSHDRRLRNAYLRTTLVLFAIYSVLCFAAPEALQTSMVRDVEGGAGAALRFAIGLLPAVPLAIWFVYLYTYYQKLDEIHRAVAERAALITTGVTLTFTTAYGFLEINLDYPHFPLFFIYHVVLGAFCIAYFVILKRMTS